jgi:hypothetical protein
VSRRIIQVGIPGDSAEWGFQYRKNECRQGSAIVGVSRNLEFGGAIHGVLSATSDAVTTKGRV